MKDCMDFWSRPKPMNCQREMKQRKEVAQLLCLALNFHERFCLDGCFDIT